MEHLGIAIWQNPSIQGLSIDQRQYILFLYADDLLLDVSNPHISLPAIVKAFMEFGLISNFKVNYDKTEALNISLCETTLSQLQSNFAFECQKKTIKYLGILLPWSWQILTIRPCLVWYICVSSSMINQTFPGLAAWMLSKWMCCLNFFIPFRYSCSSPSVFFLSVNRDICNFIWQCKRPCISATY